MKKIRLGLIVPSSNITMESEFNTMIPEVFSIHAARIRMKDVTPNELKEMDKESIRAALELSDSEVSVIGYGCTIAIANQGLGYDTKVKNRIERKVKIPTVVSLTAIIDALKYLRARAVAIAMPYTKALALSELRYLKESGFQIVDYKTLGIKSNIKVGELDEKVTENLVMSLDYHDADAILISCAQMPSAGIIEKVERQTRRPVISTNTATLWSMMRKINAKVVISGFGSLLAKSVTD